MHESENIIRMDYKIYKKKKVFREKYDSDIIQKYINIFLFLRKLKRNLN